MRDVTVVILNSLRIKCHIRRPLINFTTCLDYTLCTLAIVVSGYLYINLYICKFVHLYPVLLTFQMEIPPVLKCPVRNNFTCSSATHKFFYNDVNTIFFATVLYNMFLGVLLGYLVI